MDFESPDGLGMEEEARGTESLVQQVQVTGSQGASVLEKGLDVLLRTFIDQSGTGTGGIIWVCPQME